MTAVDPRPPVVERTSAAGSLPAQHRPPPAARTTPPRTLRSTAVAYVALTKPRIIELLLVTTVPTMVLAARGAPPLDVLAWTLVGGSFAAAGANVLNCYLDRDIDERMHRTGRRPLVTGAVTPREALVLGLVLSALSVVVLAGLVNAVSAALGAAAIATYVLGYTVLLKRRTPQNIVWGGAAGCMPVLIGWSAVTGSLDWPALLLFGVVFLWTPPHYWPLSMRFRDDYAAAGVPMLPVVASDEAVARRILRYAVAMVAVSLLLWPVAGMSPVYAALATLLGGAFVGEALALQRRARAGLAGPSLAAMRLFHGSISYLTLLFVAVAVDPFLPLH